VWAEIDAENPDVLLLLGDNVYLDHDGHGDPASLAAELRALYARQLAEPSFRMLRAGLDRRGAALEAIYDDHDFLGNDRCGGDVADALRNAARAAFITAFSPVMTGQEVYRVQQLGLVDLVVLDVRFHRRSADTSGDDEDAILGRAQWAWFEALVRQSQAPYLLVASSTTLHRYGDASWEQYPAAFERMRNVLRGRPGALVVSGDVHHNAAYDESGVIEIVTSGVAQRSRLFGTERRNYGVLTFDERGVHVQLRSLKVGSRFDFRIDRTDWQLP
jgi:alkaline phosphatase D